MAFVTYDPEDHTVEDVVSAIFTESAGLTLVPGSVTIRHGAPAGEASTIAFYDGFITPLNIGGGLMLTTGDPTPPTSNTSGGYGPDAGSGAADETDADLQSTVDFAFEGAGQVRDVTVIEFQVLLTDETLKGISFDIVFCSDEYPEFSGSSFVDVGGVYVNGVNYALFADDPKKPLSVVKANLAPAWNGFGLNGYFRDNNTNKYLPIEFDGISVKLQVTAPLQLGVNTIKIAIADTGDSILDSAMFIANAHGTTYEGYGIAQQVLVPDTGVTDIPNNQNYYGGEKGTVIQFSSAGGGQDIFDGGPGIDTAQFEAELADVTLTVGDELIVVEYGEGHVANLVNTEHLQFGETTYLALDTDVGENSYVVYAMLNAWFNGAPDVSVLSRWIDRSMELKNLELGYEVLGDEMVSAYANTPYLEDVIALLYQNIIGVAPDSGTVAVLASLIGPGLLFESIGDLFAYGAMLEPNTAEIAGMVGTQLQLDAGWF
ncbi:MAG: choice-of-anchor L domain-containing protein [Burkholderiales bacterium]|nr:choice-of-anchor L domain-containing protein [Burkholderiales bacterium]